MYEAFGLEANSTASLIPRSLRVDGSGQCPSLVRVPTLLLSLPN